MLINWQQVDDRSNIQKENKQIDINPDSLIAYKVYDNKLKTLRNRLDSLGIIHEEITVKLRDLKSRSDLIRKDQQQADLINGGIVVIIAVILIKIIHSKVKPGKK